MIDRLKQYNQRITNYSTEKQNLENKQKNLPLLRLLLFLLTLFLAYKYLTIQSAWSGSITILVFIAFLILSFIDSRLKNRIKRFEVLILINEKEINALNGDYSTFDPGNEFIDQSHDYTHDLDIFGEGSLFQYINRTATIFGKLRLAEYFNNAFGYSDNVIQRQEGVKELSEMVEMRQNLQLMFHNEKINESDKTEMAQWLESESPVSNLKLLKILAYGLPTVTLICIMLSIFGIIGFPIFLIVSQLMIVFLYARQTIKVQSIITSKSKILIKYAQCLDLIEKTDFQSRYFAGIREQLIAGEKQSPSKAIHQLSVILKYMDSNLNILVSIILNGLFMFNLHLLLKVEKWKKQNQNNVPNWFDTIATFDAMSSLANFAYNHNEFIYPELFEDDYRFEAENLGHPLIDCGSTCCKRY